LYVPTTFAWPVPVDAAVKVAEQVAVPRVPAVKLHGLPVKLPPAVPVKVTVNDTVPVGVIWVPGLLVGSVTVAVHNEVWPGEMLDGEHETVVVVGRVLTTMLVVPLLEL
jgi:hypothetical protein